LRCEACAQPQIACNSCRNRHRPKCQACAARGRLEARQADLLPVGSVGVAALGAVASAAFRSVSLSASASGSTQCRQPVESVSSFHRCQRLQQQEAARKFCVLVLARKLTHGSSRPTDEIFGLGVGGSGNRLTHVKLPLGAMPTIDLD